MSWKDRIRKKLSREEIFHQDVPFTTITRWFIYDAVPVDDHEELAELVGLSPISDEGVGKELDDSIERLTSVTPLAPFLDTMAEISSNVFTTIQLQELGEDDNLNEDILKLMSSMQELYQSLALYSLVGAFSAALSLGLVTTNTVSTRTHYKEDLFDE